MRRDDRCDTIRVAMHGGEYPYVIPMTFGCELKDGSIIVYFHSAGAGRKWDILTKDPRVCVEADKYYQVKRTDDGEITAVWPKPSPISTNCRIKLPP